MPTAKPRVNITLDQDTYDTLKSFSEATGQSMSSVLGDMAKEAVPMLQRAVQLAEQLTQATTAHREAVRREVEQIDQQVQDTRTELLNALNQATLPPHTNRGVTPTNPPHLTIKKSR